MLVDIIFILFVLAIGFTIPSWLLKPEERELKMITQLLWVVHFAIGTIYYFFTRNGGGDAWEYWERSKLVDVSTALNIIGTLDGTYFVYALNTPFGNFLQLGFYANTLLYTLLGFVGCMYFLLLAYRHVSVNTYFQSIPLFPVLFFLPNLHFWSSGLGKDSLLFFCVSGIFYALDNIKTRIPLLVIASLLSLFVRPHVTLFVYTGLGIASFLQSGLSIHRKIFLSLFFAAGAAVVLPRVLEFTKLESLDASSIAQRSEAQVELLSQQSGSGVAIQNYPLPLKVLTFLYRPTFIDINNAIAVIAAFENLLLLLVSIKAFWYRPWQTFKQSPLLIKSMLIYGLISAVLFSMSLGNLGITLRMRNMMLPCLIIYILYALSQKRIRNNPSLLTNP